MKAKLSDFVIEFVAGLGIRHAFIVSGGASIHLLHSLHKCPGIEPVCPHHEQAGAMAADAYARATGGLGCAIGTSGPGATNMITGIAGAWFDSIPVLYITGQVTTFRLKGSSGVRQYGFQETEILPMVAPITKYAVQITDPGTIRLELEKAVHIATSGRPGPVLIDLPDDLQRMQIDTDALPGFEHRKQGRSCPTAAQIDAVDQLVATASRPVFVWGSGIRLAGAADRALALAERWQMPVLTSWGAKDLLPGDHPLNAGTFGTHGTRAGNFTMQNADMVLAIGARLSTRETGSPLSDWARGARVAVIDVDEAELAKFAAFERPIDVAIAADAAMALDLLLERNARPPDLSAWRARIGAWRDDYPVVPQAASRTEGIDPYALMSRLTESAPGDMHFFTDTGCSVAWLMQAGKLRGAQRVHHDFNNTAMGWGLPAAMAGALALGRPTLCLTGDGSLMMNVQEMATVARHGLPVRIVLLDNAGYSMVRQTEEQWLGGVNVGTSVESGLGFPDWCALAGSFGLASVRLHEPADTESALREVFDTPGPVLLHVRIDPGHRVVPQVAFGYGIEDAEPHLPRDEFLSQMIVDPLPRSLEPTDPARTLPPKSERVR